MGDVVAVVYGRSFDSHVLGGIGLSPVGFVKIGSHVQDVTDVIGVAVDGCLGFGEFVLLVPARRTTGQHTSSVLASQGQGQLIVAPFRCIDGKLSLSKSVHAPFIVYRGEASVCETAESREPQVVHAPVKQAFH